MHNVLVTSCGRRVALVRCFTEALAMAGLEGEVLTCDLHPLNSARFASSAFFRAPRCDSQAYIDFLLRLCTDHSIKLLVPTIDTELKILAANSEKFSARGVRLHVPPPAAVDIALDKLATYEFLRRHGFPTVESFSTLAALSLTAAAFPLLAKPVRGSSSVGVGIVSTHDQLRAKCGAAIDDWLVQRIAKGSEFTVSVYLDTAGRGRCAIPRERLATRAGEVSKGRTVRDAGLQELALGVAEALPGATGTLNVQIFKDADDLKVIEINARFGGGFPLAWAAGGLYPYWLLQESNGVTPDFSPEWQDDLHMVRYDDAFFVSGATL